MKDIPTSLGIIKNLSLDSARLTFAKTVTLSNGVLIETVSKTLEHTKIFTTQMFVRVLESKISIDIKNLKVQLNSVGQKPAIGVL